MKFSIHQNKGFTVRQNLGVELLSAISKD